MEVKGIEEEHSEIRSTFIKLPSAIKIFVLCVLSCRLRQVLLYYQIQVQIHKIFVRKNVNNFLPISFNMFG